MSKEMQATSVLYPVVSVQEGLSGGAVHGVYRELEELLRVGPPRRNRDEEGRRFSAMNIVYNMLYMVSHRSRMITNLQCPGINTSVLNYLLLMTNDK